MAPLAAGGSKAAFRIAGGNARLVDGLLTRAAAHVHRNTRVVGVRLDVSSEAVRKGQPHSKAAGPYVLHLQRAGGAQPQTSQPYDYVLLAAPCPTGLSRSPLVEAMGEGEEASGPNLLSHCTAVQYQEVHTTLVYGLLNPALIGGGDLSLAEVRQSAARIAERPAAPDLCYPRVSSTTLGQLNAEFADVLVADGAGVPFNSIGRVGASAPAAVGGACAAELAEDLPPGTPLPRWKLFSPQQLSASDLDAVFLCRAGSPHLVRHAWDAPGAYPVSRPLPLPTGTTRGFVLDVRSTGVLLHPSAIETATSAMEVMAVAGANAARLVMEHLKSTSR